MPISAKQLQSYSECDRRINLWVGAVRSGKTYISIFRLLDLIKNGPPGDCMIVGASRATIQRNVLEELYKFLGWAPPASKSTQAMLYGRNIYFTGCNDEGAIRSIQGVTLAIAYVDEATLLPEPCWNMLLSRISVPGAKILATCNPQGPAHWLKKKWIDRSSELNMGVWNFTLDDNPYLEQEYKDCLKAEYGSGMWFNRYILGQWSAATGIVYDAFDEMNKYFHDYPQPNMWVAAIDYGTVNPTCCLLAGLSPRRFPQIHIEKEYYYDSMVTGRQKTDAELADDIQKFIFPISLEALYVDPSAASLKIELRNRNLPVLDANNDVLLGIQHVAKFTQGKNLVIHEKCENLLDQMQSYQWCPKAQSRGEDKPLKQNDHCFGAGTKVETDRGNINIEDIRVGDRCLTHNGYHKVIRTGANIRKVHDYLLYGKKLTCTSDHRFYTHNGWKEISSLIPSDILFTNGNIWRTRENQNTESVKSEHFKEESIEDILNPLTHLKEIIFQEMGSICIEKFGNITMESFPLDIISITLTGTPLTMIYPIYNVSHRSIILKFMNMIFEAITSLKKLESKQPNGMQVPQGSSGTKNTQKKCDLENGNRESIAAKCVAKNMKLQNDPKQNFVQITVKVPSGEKLELILSQNVVDLVINPLNLTNITETNSVLANAQVDSERDQEVFNLEIDSYPEFFANGFLIHNSVDALRYLIASSYPHGTFDDADENLTIQQIRAHVYGENNHGNFLDSSSGYY